MEQIQKQRDFFESQGTHDIYWRKARLRELQQAIKTNESALYEAFKHDLGKSQFEAYTTEIAIVYREIKYMLQNLDRLSLAKRVRTPWVLMGKRSEIRKQPRGNVLIMSPFNYPVQLSLVPLVGAIAAGNTAIVKLSEFTPSINQVLINMLNVTFDDHYIYAMDGDVSVNTKLLDASFDFIFFTGSPHVGKIVMRAASEHLTPVILELGGKSPAIVLDDAKIKAAAQKIIWGKLINTGQTCVAPDYVLVHESRYDDLVEAMKKAIESFYGQDIKNNRDYGRIVNETHAKRLRLIISDNKENIIYGGDSEGRYVAPTLLRDTILDDEIFGPILPIQTFKEIHEVKETIAKHPNPLALYLFTETEDHPLLNEVRFGGGIVNDTVLHLVNDRLPFGGVRTSGIGHYHGEHSFDAFSHVQGIMHSTSRSLPVMYPPYTSWYKRLKIIRKVF
ncbi:aldehyde dehydrogenase family protein [Erysipelothrix sp. HDW6C]|uniref:aldehyde dehydrogenase family protein n=1 Tax=Erysipelothrix sp. HDW6C TaxID=2714930 RepID=UPI00140B1EF8|nr:aldehyde dehydrogenase family protein [Erysipelothrix sp. HDW6C]QIK69036.1 aldehyde dehydrogenase family protein [Erysipelothrix sp. HDW6C]